jgi:hypothetical protein
MEPISGSILSVKGVFAAIGLLIATISGFAIMDNPHAQADEHTNFLVTTDNTHSDFSKDISIRASGINNTITNMLNGDVSIAKATKAIRYEKVYSRDQTGISPDDMQINKAYMDYLESAEDVVNAYTYEDPELKSKVSIMSDKKELI